MYKHILLAVALDHERDTDAAIDIAHKLLAKGGKITALHVMEAMPSYATQYLPADHMANFRKETQNALQQIIRNQADLTPVVITGHAGRSIVEHAADHDVDLIVISSHRPGLQDYFLGSTAARVVRHATCAVHVIR